MAKHVIQISELEAGRFSALLARLRAGEEIVIEDESRPVAVVHPAAPVRRTVSECIALAQAHEQETGEAPVLDPDFADDMADPPQAPPSLEPAPVGVILDSSVVISAERKGKTVREILEQVRAAQGEVDLGLSVVTVAELTHGAYRAQTDMQQKRRLAFIEELARDVPVYPVTLEIARTAGRIQGQQEALGIRCLFADLFIGVTALNLGYQVATFNVRHFQSIPGLQVFQP